MKPYTEFIVICVVLTVFCMLIMQCVLYWNDLDLISWRRALLMGVIVFVTCLVMERVGHIIFLLMRK